MNCVDLKGSKSTLGKLSLRVLEILKVDPWCTLPPILEPIYPQILVPLRPPATSWSLKNSLLLTLREKVRIEFWSQVCDCLVGAGWGLPKNGWRPSWRTVDVGGDAAAQEHNPATAATHWRHCPDPGRDALSPSPPPPWCRCPHQLLLWMLGRIKGSEI